MNFRKWKSAFVYLLISLICPLNSAQAQTAPPVPAGELKMYSALSQTLGTFQTSLDKRPQTASATPFAAKLDSADASNGPGMLQPIGLKNVGTQVARYKQLGVQGVVIHMAFPVLTQQYLNANPSAGTLQQWTSFYQQVVQQCHQAGLKVMVESHPIYPSPTDVFSQQTAKYMQSLNAADFQSAMVQNNGNVAAVKPDFISIVNEPNTDFAWTNQSVFRSPTGLAALVQACTKAINAASPGTVAAAGAPNWQVDAQKFDTLFYQIPGLKAIDIHIYFAGNSGLETATALADEARSNGKQVVVSESWLSKTGEGVPPATPQPNQANIERANASYSFWQPLDAQFIYSFFKWCNVEQPTFYTFFFSQLLFANLDYNQVHTMSDTAIIQAESQAEKQAISADQFTSVGTYYSKLLTAPRQSQY